jgi:hypothetical protein
MVRTDFVKPHPVLIPVQVRASENIDGIDGRKTVIPATARKEFEMG